MIGLNDIGEQLFGQKRHSYKVQDQPPSILHGRRSSTDWGFRGNNLSAGGGGPTLLMFARGLWYLCNFFRPDSLFMCSVLSLSVPKFSCVIGPGRRRWYCPSNTVFEVLDIYSKGRGKNSVNQRRGDGKRNPKTYQEHSSDHWSIIAVLMSPNDFEHGKDVQCTYHIGVWVFLVYSTSLVLGWQSTFSISLLSGNGMSPHLIFPPFSYCIQLYNSPFYFDLSYHSLYHLQNIIYKLLTYYSNTIHHY